MPRNVRPFWAEVRIDGQKTKLAGGPKSLDGGIEATFKIREEGSVSPSRLYVKGTRNGDTLTLRAWIEKPGEDRQEIRLETTV